MRKSGFYIGFERRKVVKLKQPKQKSAAQTGLGFFASHKAALDG
jgi:hypothetical protein